MIWGLANAYRALFNTIPEREKEIFLWMLAIHKFTLVSLSHKKVIQQQMRNAKYLYRL